MDNNSNRNESFYTPEDLRNVLRQLWNQHAMWIRFFLISAISKSEDLEVVTNRLLEIPRDFSNVLGIYYGNIEELENLFREHLMITITLIHTYIASNAMNESTSDIVKIENQWYQNATELADFFSNVNPYWDKRMFQNLIFNHLDMIKDEILKRLTYQYAAEVYQYDFLEYHALMIADIMASGITKQFYN